MQPALPDADAAVGDHGRKPSRVGLAR